MAVYVCDYLNWHGFNSAPTTLLVQCSAIVIVLFLSVKNMDGTSSIDFLLIVTHISVEEKLSPVVIVIILSSTPNDDL